MRVSNQLLTNEILSALNANRSELAKVNRQLSTQRTVNDPSDNPGAYATSRELEARISRNELYQNNIQSGIEEARVATESIDLMADQLRELKRLSTQGASDVLDPQGMITLADRVAGIRETLVQQANKNINGRYLFAGTEIQTKPFEVSGINVTYSGNDETLEVAVSEGTTVETSVNGTDLFTFNGSDNVFDMIERIETALRNNDSQGVNAELDAITEAVGAVSSRASELGNNINRMEFSYYEFESSNLALTSNVSRLVDTDYAEAISRFQNLQTAYEASLSSSARLLQLSLVNFL